jgi:hypothetical protein
MRVAGPLPPHAQVLLPGGLVRLLAQQQVHRLPARAQVQLLRHLHELLVAVVQQVVPGHRLCDVVLLADLAQVRRLVLSQDEVDQLLYLLGLAAYCCCLCELFVVNQLREELAGRHF